MGMYGKMLRKRSKDGVTVVLLLHIFVYAVDGNCYLAHAKSQHDVLSYSLLSTSSRSDRSGSLTSLVTAALAARRTSSSI